MAFQNETPPLGAAGLVRFLAGTAMRVIPETLPLFKQQSPVLSASSSRNDLGDDVNAERDIRIAVECPRGRESLP